MVMMMKSSPDIENRNFYKLCLYKWNDRVRGFSTPVFCNYEDCIIVGIAEARKLLNHHHQQSAAGKLTGFLRDFLFSGKRISCFFPICDFFQSIEKLIAVNTGAC